jgi:hypothetical protein
MRVPTFAVDEHEAEIKLGSLEEAPTGLTPTYELWIKRENFGSGRWTAPEQLDEDST